MIKTEEERKANARLVSIYLAVVIGILVAYFFAYAYSVSNTGNADIGAAATRIFSGQLFFVPKGKSFLGIVYGLAIGVAVYFLSMNDTIRKSHYQEDAAVDTGGFMKKKEEKEFLEKYCPPEPPVIDKGLPVTYDPQKDKELYSQNMIMSYTFKRPIDSRILIGNNNVLVVGGAGTGKSRFFIKPNVLQMNASYVITDPSGEMIYSLGKVLKDHGYKIKIFNISDMAHSNCYNPFAYIRDEAGVAMLIECLINNTTKGEGGGDNQFFVDAEKLLYSACIFYMKDFCQEASIKNFAGVMDMINASSVDETNPGAKSPVDMIFDKLPHNSLAWKYYKAFKQAAGKTLKSIIISCVTRLQPFLTPQVVNLTRTDTLHLEKIGDEKTALFIITPQADRTYAFLASILYSQLFETLYHIGEGRKAEFGDERLPIPVRCMMDEFANIGEVPHFPSKLATMRKYNISATIVLQDISQIEAMYKDEWKTLVGNCSSIVFLGTQEPNTLKYFSEMLGKMTIRTKSSNLSHGSKSGSSEGYQNTGREVMTANELGRMPSNECIVYTQNFRPVRDEKFKYETHPYYPQTADADDANAFQYTKISIYNNTKLGNITSLIKAQEEAARIREAELKKKTRLRSASEVTFKDSNVDILEHVSMGKKEDDKRYRQLVAGAKLKALETGNEPVCMISISGLAISLLPGFTKQVSIGAHKPALVVFDDITLKEDEFYIYGIAIDRENIGLAEKLKTSRASVRQYGEYCVVKVSKHVLDLYKEEVLDNFGISPDDEDDAK